MSCSHCSSADQPAVDPRRRFCVGCGKRLPLSPSLALVRRGRQPLRPAAEVPAAV